MSKTLKILSRPKGNAEEYGKWSVNPYIGCCHGCLYCYLKKGPSGAYLGQDSPVLKKGVVNDEHAYHLAMAEIIENREEIVKDGGLFMTFTSDPLAHEVYVLFAKIANECARLAVPVTILTKSTMFMDTRSCEELRCASVGWTLTGHDELEPNAAPNDFRIEAMKCLSERGYRTWASIEPVITFDASFEMIKQAVDAGCQHFKIGLMTKNTKVCRGGFSFGGHDFAPYKMDECVDFVEYVMALTDGRATVYWKQSFVDYLQQSEKHPQPVRGMTAREFLSQWKHSVSKDWSMFNNK